MDESTVEPVVIVLRNLHEENDLPMIFSTWRNSSYYSAQHRPEGSPTKVFRQKTDEIRSILKDAKIRVACLKDSPQTIIGYSVHEKKHLHWVYVKPEYRRQGIAKTLVPREIETIPQELTVLGERIAEKKPYKKGETNGRNSKPQIQEDDSKYIH